MRLPPEQVERFYNIWKPLILFVNRQRGLVPNMLSMKWDDPGRWHVPDVHKIRQALWADDALREQFITENSAGLAAADLAIVRNWKYRRAGAFYFLRQLKSYAIFVSEKGPVVYGVLGLASTLDEVVPFVPCMVDAVLLPWEDRIVYDSMLAPYNVTFGSGIRGSLNRTYQDAKERGAIITSVLPSGPSESAQGRRDTARDTNAKVLDAFEKHLYKSGVSPRVVPRDVELVGRFADFLDALPEPRSLREFGRAEVDQYLAAPQPGAPRTKAEGSALRTGMTRLVKFLRDTERMDYGEAERLRKRLGRAG